MNFVIKHENITCLKKISNSGFYGTCCQFRDDQKINSFDSSKMTYKFRHLTLPFLNMNHFNIYFVSNVLNLRSTSYNNYYNIV